MVLFLNKGVVLAFEDPHRFWEVNLGIFRYHDIHSDRTRGEILVWYDVFDDV